MMEKSFQQEINRLHAQICQGLADPTRIFIIYTLNEGSQRVTDMVEALDMPQSTLSHHLKVLRERGLVDVEREGTAAYYSLADPRIVEALDMLRSILADTLRQQAELAQKVE